MNTVVDASDLLKEAVERRNIHMSLLVADTGLWANPEFHQRLLRDTRAVALFPNVRRARLGQGERRGQIVEGGVRLDDNSYANLAIKRATGLGKSAKGFEACHIWPLTCYEERYHTAVANIVLLPRALAGLTDHDIEIQKALQYRAFELYGWHPEEEPQPVKPIFYPAEWRNPLPDPAANLNLIGPKRKRDAEILPITLDPPSIEEFTSRLLDSKRAELSVHYETGKTETRPWNAQRLSEASNLLGNLRSRPLFRQGEWQKKGIIKVHVRVLTKQ